jgi:hypothetical protein
MMRSDGIPSIVKDMCTLDIRQFQEKHYSLTRIIILETPTTVCSHPPLARTNKRSRGRNQGHYSGFQECNKALDCPNTMSK